jgi:hypothetical protein
VICLQLATNQTKGATPGGRASDRLHGKKETLQIASTAMYCEGVIQKIQI